MSNPYDVANLAAPALGGIIRALSERRNQTDAETTAKAESVTRLILSFLPRDAIDLLLSGQAVLFNELLADGARDALCEEVDTAKPRQRSALVSMGRVMQGHLDRLERRGNQPYRDVAVVEDGCPVTVEPPAETCVPRTEPRPDLAAPVLVSAAPEEVAVAGGMPTGDPMIGMSWLDEPYEQWLIETPADLAAHAAMMARTEAAGMTRDPIIDPDDAADRRGEDSDIAEPAMPRTPSVYRAVKLLAEAAAG